MCNWGRERLFIQPLLSPKVWGYSRGNTDLCKWFNGLRSRTAKALPQNSFWMHLSFLSSFWHQNTEHWKSLPYLQLFEFCMCTDVVVFLIKRKLLIKGIKALKKAAAAVSTGFILSQQAAGSWLLLRAAKVDCHIHQWGYSRQRPTGHGDFQQDGAEAQLCNNDPNIQSSSNLSISV